MNELSQQVIAKASEIDNLNGKIKILESTINKQTRTIEKLSDKISTSDKDKTEILNQKSILNELENENYMLKNELR